MRLSSAMSKLANGVVVLGLVLSSLAGLVCADAPGEQQAMECCRGDAHHCNMPAKSDNTEDCCKPDRTSQNPASVEASYRSGIDDRSAAHVAVLAPVIKTPDVVFRFVPLSSSRGSPYARANRPLDIPLLN